MLLLLVACTVNVVCTVGDACTEYEAPAEQVGLAASPVTLHEDAHVHAVGLPEPVGQKLPTGQITEDTFVDPAAQK